MSDLKNSFNRALFTKAFIGFVNLNPENPDTKNIVPTSCWWEAEQVGEDEYKLYLKFTDQSKHVKAVSWAGQVKGISFENTIEALKVAEEELLEKPGIVTSSQEPSTKTRCYFRNALK